MLTSFEISGFRAFSHLRIPRLGRVNLFVGKNGVGKSSLLEAVQLYTASGSPAVVQAILLGRDEFGTGGPPRNTTEPLSRRYLAVDSLFHRHIDDEFATEIRLGPTTDSQSATMRISRTRARKTQLASSDDVVGYRWEEAQEGDSFSPETVQALIIEFHGERRFVPYHRLADRFFAHREPISSLVPAQGVRERDLALWWDAVSLREAEERIVQCLNPFAPIEKISLVESPPERGGRKPLVRLKGAREPVPLRSLGDGIVHMFQIALALEYTGCRLTTQQPALFPDLESSSLPLLIDEVENGIHFSLHAKMWSFILQLASLHGLQVFATTHSWDCIQGFQAAALSDSSSEGVLIRIERINDKYRAVTFTEDELKKATKEDIEVR